jgi:hypothetical protein
LPPEKSELFFLISNFLFPEIFSIQFQAQFAMSNKMIDCAGNKKPRGARGCKSCVYCCSGLSMDM